MIAKPESTSTTQPPATAPVVVEASPLSADELYQLTLYKWRYSLEALGFEHAQVRELMFLKWLHASRRVEP